MSKAYDAAVTALYQAPHAEFVSERKRLAGELTRAGDKAEAALFSKLPRPSVSAWAVNQLWWRERDTLEALFKTGERLREGELEATAEHRKLTATLVAHAGDLLKETGNAASDTTLRRVSATLGALAATGGFDPDPPGALKSDRDPPGFDALDLALLDKPAAPKPAPRAAPDDGEAAARAQAASAAERRRLAQEQAQLRAERRHLEGALRAVKADLERHTTERERLTQALSAVDSDLERTRTTQTDLEARLAKLPPESA